MFSETLKIPSVILLLATGIALNYVGGYLGYTIPDTKFLLELLGIVGLIFIVLEGTLDLELKKKKVPLIGKSLLAAVLILVATCSIIGFILYELLDIPIRNAIVYSVPLGVISSAIAIPSVGTLSDKKKEFIVYESTFSDILGIMIFNYVILDNLLSNDSIITFFIQLLIIIGVSIFSTVFLLFLLNYTRSHIKFYLIFAILILIYSISKMFHLPSLLLILIFGLMLNNAGLFIKGKLANYLHLEHLGQVTAELKLITSETAFIVRTFFFLIFGYSINLILLQELDTVVIGSLIIITILITRLIFLRSISYKHVFPEVFIAPRGLITIVLFYSIPPHLQSIAFSEGILFYVIIVSSIIMMLGIMFSDTKYRTELDDI